MITEERLSLSIVEQKHRGSPAPSHSQKMPPEAEVGRCMEKGEGKEEKEKLSWFFPASSISH